MKTNDSTNRNQVYTKDFLAQSCLAIDGKNKFNMPTSPKLQELTTLPVMRSHRNSSSHLLVDSAIPTPSKVYSYQSENDLGKRKKSQGNAVNIYGNFSNNSSARGSLNSSQKFMTQV